MVLHVPTMPGDEEEVLKRLRGRGIDGKLVAKLIREDREQR